MVSTMDEQGVSLLDKYQRKIEKLQAENERLRKEKKQLIKIAKELYSYIDTTNPFMRDKEYENINNLWLKLKELEDTE